MSTKAAPAQRSPLSPYALTLDDMVEGLKIVRYHTLCGVLDDGIIIQAPHTVDGKLAVGVYNYYSGADIRFLADLGVTPYPSGKFSDVCYTIAASNKSRMPRRVIPMPNQEPLGEPVAGRRRGDRVGA